MKRYIVGFAVLSLFSLVGFGMPLCNYHAPVSDLSNLGMSFSYHYYNDPYGLHDQDINAGSFQVHYTRIYDSPDFGYDFAAKNDMTISVLSLSTYNVNADGSVKRYLSPDRDFFGFAGVCGKTASNYETIGISVNLGLGYGRFANVTPLAKAIEIDSYLVARGSLADHLSDIDLQALAHEIDNASTYPTTADLLSALQEIVEGSGLVKEGGLDALDISEMGNIVRDNTHSRYCGGEAKLGLSYEILDPMGGANDLFATASFNYAFTATPRSQFLIQGSITGPLDIVKEHELSAAASYDYLISDFLSFSGSYTFVQEARPGEVDDSHKITINLDFTPIRTARITLEMMFEHEPYYLEWSQEVRLSIGTDLL